MGTLRSKGAGADDFTVVTDTATSDGPGSEKESHVTIEAADNIPGRDLWVGLKVAKNQTVRKLEINDPTVKVWVNPNSVEDTDATKAFGRLFAPGPNERWAGYRIPHNLKPQALAFRSKLNVRPRVSSYPDAQTVTIAVCYVPTDPSELTTKDVLIGHSLIPSPKRARRRPGPKLRKARGHRR